MIRLLERDPKSAFGIATILDIEKIPYVRVCRPDEGGDALLVVAGHVRDEREAADVLGQPSVVFDGGPHLARSFAAGCDADSRSASSSIRLNDRCWPAGTVKIARAFDKTTVRIPRAPICPVSRVGADSEVLATYEGSQGSGHDDAPAILLRGHSVWATVDLGQAFADLTTEDYFSPLPETRRGAMFEGLTQRGTRGSYCTTSPAVFRLRGARHREELEQRLGRGGASTSDYPIDTTGWLIMELVRGLLLLASGRCVRLARWPAPHESAAMLTHDIEPRRYAYKRGLDRLLDHADVSGNPSAIGLVADASARFLSSQSVTRLQRHAVMCHGLAHRGESSYESSSSALRTIRAAKTRLELQLGREIVGFRNPCYDRSTSLQAALDEAGFRYDSSWPDVDRKRDATYGAGVRLNVPFRPPILDRTSRSLRPSRCLELPLTAPDCIEPVLNGRGFDELTAEVERKATFIRATGGIYVARVHGGAFGNEDARTRGCHLAFVTYQLKKPGVWLAAVDDLVGWWSAREQVTVSMSMVGVRVRNDGPTPVTGMRLLVATRFSEESVELPTLQPGHDIDVSLASGKPGADAVREVATSRSTSA